VWHHARVPDPMLCRSHANYASTPLASFYLLHLENWVEPFPRHWHDEWGIALIERGVNRFWYQGGWHEAPQGSIIVVPPGEIHDGGLAADPWSERMSYVSVDAMESIVRACSDRPERLAFASPIIHDTALAAELRRLHHTLSTSPPADALEAAELPIQVMGALFTRHGRLQTNASRRGEAAAVARAKQFMREFISTPITLSAVSGAAGLSQFHLIREFRKRVGLTPHAYLKQLRVTLAQRLLHTSDTIADVALAAGFSDQAHLTREFRKTLGLTPGAFRRAHTRSQMRVTLSPSRRRHVRA
jgi:AraC-like DNA-binding protein